MIPPPPPPPHTFPQLPEKKGSQSNLEAGNECMCKVTLSLSEKGEKRQERKKISKNRQVF